MAANADCREHGCHAGCHGSAHRQADSNDDHTATHPTGRQRVENSRA